MDFQLFRLQDTLVQTDDCLKFLLTESGRVVHRGESISQAEDATLHNVLIEEILFIGNTIHDYFVQNGEND